jgi:2-iminobutanoate/2-iminopropanoate deaminase
MNAMMRVALAFLLAAASLFAGCVTVHSMEDQMSKARTIIDTPKAPQPAAPISQAVRSNGLLFVSGVTPFDTNLKLVVGDFDAQFKQVMTNVGTVLQAGGTDFAHVLKCTVILARVQDWPRMNTLYASYWPSGSFPARTAFQAPLPSADFLVEVECVAEVP